MTGIPAARIGRRRKRRAIERQTGVGEVICVEEIISAIVCGMLSIVSLIISVRSFREKGFLFNNAYIWASKRERARMDKRPHYRQSAIVFALMAALFLCMALECVLQTRWLWIVEGGIAVAVLGYAMASSVRE